MSRTLNATLTLIGATVGAGILAIPYVIQKSGFGLGLIMLIAIAVVMLLTNLYLGEIALRTRGTHQLSGYAEKYFGRRGKILMFLAVIIGIYGALVAYLVGEGQSLSFFIFGNLQYEIYLGIAFWIVAAALSWFGLKALEESEEVGVTIIFIMIISILVFSINKIEISNLAYVNPSEFLTPFGVILFAFLGFSAIPEVIRILKQQKSSLKRALIVSNLTVLVIYIIFATVVLGWKGSMTPPIATLVLGKPFILLGMITMFTAYLVHTTALMDSLRFDFRKSRFESWLIATAIPLALFVILRIFNLAGFTKILGIGGTISGGLTGIFILLMVKRAKLHGEEKPAYSIPYSKIIAALLIIIFAVGAFFEIYHSF